MNSDISTTVGSNINSSKKKLSIAQSKIWISTKPTNENRIVTIALHDCWQITVNRDWYWANIVPGIGMGICLRISLVSLRIIPWLHLLHGLFIFFSLFEFWITVTHLLLPLILSRISRLVLHYLCLHMAWNSCDTFDTRARLMYWLSWAHAWLSRGLELPRSIFPSYCYCDHLVIWYV